MITWFIQGHRNAEKILDKLPREILKKYELWKEIVLNHGPEKLHLINTER